jgi:hypothetical protein
VRIARAALAFFRRMCTIQHTRKAAGSTLRAFLEANVANNHKWAFDVNEGRSLSPDKAKPSSELWVTALRNPISRALSSYAFEGRWAQCHSSNSENRTTANARSLKDWANWANAQQKAPHDFDGVKLSPTMVWHCASNCQTKWFGGW